MKREPHIHTPAHDPPRVLMPLMAGTCQPVERQSATEYMRALLDRTIATLKDRGRADG